MILSSLTPAFAAEKNTTSEMNSVKEEAVARNVDLATIPTQTWTGSITFQVTPSKGDNMKLHLYIYDGGCDVFHKGMKVRHYENVLVRDIPEIQNWASTLR